MTRKILPLLLGVALCRPVFADTGVAPSLNWIAGSMVMNERTAGRALQSRMLEEFTWNRQRYLAKTWGDVGFGGYEISAPDDMKFSGNRFMISGGADVQTATRTVFGVMGYASHTPGGYSAENIEISNTGAGFGAYMMGRLGQQARAYGRAGLNLDLFRIEREQPGMDSISGSGTAFALFGEAGILHNIYLQYFLGNLYVRGGYNMGLDVTENIGFDTYMVLQHDGHFLLTPGYELIMQRRLYTSTWVFLRPYAAVGVEYDVMGLDNLQYRRSNTLQLTDYEIDINPVWVTGRAGLELVSAGGGSVGIEAEYKHNEIVRMMAARISTTLRF
jgi:hypothetical protein